jgi:hypothetical protein
MSQNVLSEKITSLSWSRCEYYDTSLLVIHELSQRIGLEKLKSFLSEPIVLDDGLMQQLVPVAQAAEALGGIDFLREHIEMSEEHRVDWLESCPEGYLITCYLRRTRSRAA